MSSHDTLVVREAVEADEHAWVIDGARYHEPDDNHRWANSHARWTVIQRCVVTDEVREDDDPTWDAVREGLAVQVFWTPCPKCGAEAGGHCVYLRDYQEHKLGDPKDRAHDERIRAAGLPDDLPIYLMRYLDADPQ